MSAFTRMAFSKLDKAAFQTKTDRRETTAQSLAVSRWKLQPDLCHNAHRARVVEKCGVD